MRYNDKFDMELMKTQARKRDELSRIGDVVSEWLKIRGNNKPAVIEELAIQDIKATWADCIGDELAKRTKVRKYEATLFVKVDSSSLRYNLLANASDLLTKIQEKHPEIKRFFWS